MIILIADDDRLARFTIKSILQEILRDSGDIFLEARDGIEMISQCREHQPDIVFADIRMPRMDGLDAIARCRENSGNTEYVIVSGYSDFKYARQGIRLGVNEYLLKPVDEEEIREVVGRLKEKVKKNRHESNSRFQLKVMNTFSYYSTVEAKETEDGENIAGDEENLKILAFMMWVKARKNDGAECADVQKTLLEEIEKLGREVVIRKGYYAAAGNSYGTPCVIFGGDRELRQYIMSRMRKLSSMVCQSEGKEAVHYFLWFERNSLDAACALCESAEDMESLLLQERPGSLCAYEALSAGEKEREVLLLTKSLADAWGKADGVACREILNKMWREYREESLNLNLTNLSLYCSCVTGCSIEDSSFKEFCRSFVENSEKMYNTARTEDADIIKQVKEYITKYYMNDISVSQIAEYFKLTANYLSTIFHQRTGERLIDYLMQTRVEAAKRLLVQNPSASVQDIALMVGYNSARHFSTLFQKQTGMTPSAYRREKTLQ